MMYKGILEILEKFDIEFVKDIEFDEVDLLEVDFLNIGVFRVFNNDLDKYIDEIERELVIFRDNLENCEVISFKSIGNIFIVFNYG